MRDYIDKKGLFKALYVDRAGIFGGPKRCNLSQMQRASNELGIEIIFANSPQGKGRIERPIGIHAHDQAIRVVPRKSLSA